MIGTIDYMSPEQMVGGECNATSDIYTLGVVMYEMITGSKPYECANSAAAALAAVLTTTPARLTALAGVPGDVDRLVMRCIERQHVDRFQSATELAEALDELLASGEEAVTTLDLTHPLGGMTTIKGMRLPAKLPVPAAAAEPASSGVVATPSVATGTIPPTVVVAPEASEPTSVPIDSTIVGPLVPPRRPARRAARRPRPSGTPQVDSLPSVRSLRESYPTIHRPPPSPLRPRPNAFDDHPSSSVRVGKFVDRSRAVRRDAYVRHLLVGIAVALAILVALLWFG
jgi:serine/threonine protein kinase